MNLFIFFQSFSNLIIDETVGAASPMENHVLAQHYDFTNEELDNLINDDIKYRMGRDNGGDD